MSPQYQVDWNVEFDGCDTYESWNIFKDKLNTLVNTLTPKQTKKSNSKPRWMTRNILRNIYKEDIVKVARCTETMKPK